MANEMREQVTEWLAGPETCFLIGTERRVMCSVIAGE